MITRRGVLLTGGAALAGGSALVALDYLTGEDGPLADSFAARRIGERYARQYPDPGTLWRGDPPATTAQWPARLSRLIADDMEAGRLVQVEGWWLAETELRLCVLVFLTHG